MADHSRRNATHLDDIVWPDVNDEQVINFSDPVDPAEQEALDRWREDMGRRRDSGGHDPDKAVGYKNPPRRGQWKAGQSGNAKGRKTVPRALTEVYERVFSRPVMTAGGEPMVMLEALMLAVAKNALKDGNPAAFRALMPLAAQVETLGEREQTEDEVTDDLVDSLTDDERRLLREIVEDEHFKKYLDDPSPDDEVNPREGPPSDPGRKR